jgi:GAF domain-containing protein
VILPLAHHNAIVALPVFAPALVVILVLIVHHLRERRHWDEEEEADRPR